MADELQKHGFDVTRALAESGGDGLVIREIAINTGGGTEGDESEVELITLIGSTFYHFPSEERLATGNAAFSSSEVITSGAELIGVDDTNFNIITGNTDLQAVLDDIDALLVSGDSGPFLLRDGTTSLTGDWETGAANSIVDLLGLRVDDGLASITQDTTNEKGLLVRSGLPVVITGDSTGFAEEALTDGDFSASTNWSFGGGWSFSTDHALFTDSGGVGTLSQLRSVMNKKVITGMWYQLTYTISNSSTGSTFAISTSNVFGAATVNLPVEDGAQTVMFKLQDAASFGIEVTSVAGAGSVEFDDISLKPIVGSDDYIFGGANTTIIGGTVTLDGRGISSGGIVSILGSNPDLRQVNDDNEDLTAANFALAARSVGGIDEAASISVSSAWQHRVETSDAGWSSSSLGVNILEQSIKDSSTTIETYFKVDGSQNQMKWPGLEGDASLTTTNGVNKLIPVITQLTASGTVTIFTLSLADATHFAFHIRTFGHESGAGTEDFFAEYLVDVYRTSAGTANIHSFTTIHSAITGTAIVNFGVSGNNFILTAVGVAAKTVNYRADVTVMDLSDR